MKGLVVPVPIPNAEHWSAAELLEWTAAHHAPNVAIASSFGAEDVVLIDLASRAGAEIRIFTLDTRVLFPETYALIDRIETRYGVTVERSYPPADAADGLWLTDPDRCCNLRKVVPLQRKLAMLDAWVTGVRRDQAPTRANTRKLEWDPKFGLVKVNPLADWTSPMVWRYIYDYDVPYNPLHDRNYPSIGCTHCTRAVAPGEDPRAGRWSGTEKTECGLHV
ncbi:MAG TPA: phosphoadenylyl-sulfate reductase [Thermoanaerobaculia bacterium]|jgi:phosphoadenosine phosphosulfate reductase